MDVRIEPSWKTLLSEEFSQPYFQGLRAFVREQYRTKAVYPPPAEIFRAFDACPADTVRVVILGQDPYHGQGQAHGLAFSVRKGVRPPPSLQNVMKELQADLGIPPSADGDLTPWAERGVFLLNATLTVEAGKPGSHQGKGWETFTDAAIRALAEKNERLVFMLWGKYAQQKAECIDPARHLVLKAAHPSPYSADRGFFGSRPFSMANAYLAAHGFDPIDWRRP